MKKILPFLLLVAFLLLPKPSFAQAPCNANSTVCGQTAYDTCTPVCTGSKAAYDCYQASNQNCRGTILCVSENSRCQVYPTPAYSYPTPSYSTPASSTPTCQTDCSKCPTTTTCGTKTYDTCIDDKGQKNSSSSFCQNGAQKFRCFSEDNPNCTSSSAGVINEYNYSCSACGPIASIPPSLQPTVSPSTNPSESPTPKKPVKIIISQFEREDQILDPSANLNEAKLNLNFDDKGIANVKFQVNYDSAGGDVKTYYVQYKLKQKSEIPSSGNEFLVDVMIQRDVHNQEKVVTWVEDTITNYINTLFNEAAINKRLKIDHIVTNFNEKTDCPPGIQVIPIYKGVACQIPADGKIRVYLAPIFYQGIVSSFSHANAMTKTAEVYLPVNEVDGGFTHLDPFLAHEIGHIFSLPDYYFEQVPSDRNFVSPGMGIEAYIQDIMTANWENPHFSETSKQFVNRISSIPILPVVHYRKLYTPKQTILKIIDDNKNPIPGVKVDVFPQVNRKIPNTLSFSRITNVDGEVDLGEVDNFMIHKNIQPDTNNDTLLASGLSVLFRIIYKDAIRYTAITRSYLNTLYFQGQTETAVITKPFSSLAVYEPGKDTILEEDQLSKSSLTVQPTTTPAPLKLIDFNNDGVINIFDYIIFAQKKLGK